MFFDKVCVLCVFLGVKSTSNRAKLPTRLDVVAGKEAGDAVHHALKPAVVVLANDVDDRVLLESQLVVFIRRVVVDGDHCGEELGERLVSYYYHKKGSFPLPFSRYVGGTQSGTAMWFGRVP